MGVARKPKSRRIPIQQQQCRTVHFFDWRVSYNDCPQLACGASWIGWDDRTARECPPHNGTKDMADVRCKKCIGSHPYQQALRERREWRLWRKLEPWLEANPLDATYARYLFSGPAIYEPPAIEEPIRLPTVLRLVR